MVPDLPCIYIHIGSFKTGTTSLQSFFYSNKHTLLKNHQIYYPSAPGKKNHIALPIYACEENIEDLYIQKSLDTQKKIDSFRKDFKNRLIKEISPQVKKGNHILLSNEHLSSRIRSTADVKRFLDLFESLEVQFKVIIYLRRQDKLIYSTYSTWIKNGGTTRLSPSAYKKKKYDYIGILKPWASEIGRENILVRPFEPAQWIDQNLYRDFCALLNTSEGFKHFKYPTKRLNPSLDKQQLSFLSSFNKWVPIVQNGKKNQYRGAIVKFLEQMPKEGKLNFPQKTLHNISNHFKDDNKLIQELYLPKSANPLFQDTQLNASENTEESKLTVETTIQIAAYLWNKQQEKINKLEKNQSSTFKRKAKRLIKRIKRFLRI